MPIQLFEQRSMLLKIESSYGTDPTPTAGTNAMLIMEGSCKLMADKLDRNVDAAYFGAHPFVLVGKRAEVEFEIDLVGHATPGTAAPCGPILRSCGMSETLSAGVSATYAPVSSSFASATIWFYHSGLLFKILGGRGTISVDMTIKQWPKAKVRYIGLIAASQPTEAAPGALTLTSFQTPGAVETETMSLTIGAAAINISAFMFDQNNELQMYEGSEAREVSIKDRKPTGTVTCFQEALATLNPWSLANAHTLNDIAAVFNNGAGKITTINVDRAQFEYPEVTDIDGASGWNIKLNAQPSTAGNDEFNIVFT